MSDINEISSEPNWYVAHTYSGYENKVKANLEKIIENRGLSDKIMEVYIPEEVTYEENPKEGVEPKKTVSKIFPSYVLIKMIMSDETWHVVRNITGVTGFVGPGSKPVPLTQEEVISIGIKPDVVSLDYNVGDSVKITADPLQGFVGVVKEISEDRKKIMVTVSMFGRETPVEVDSNNAVKI